MLVCFVLRCKDMVKKWNMQGNAKVSSLAGSCLFLSLGRHQPFSLVVL